MAGGINSIQLFDGYKPWYKALLPIVGRASIHYTLDALENTLDNNRVCIVGPEDDLRLELSGRGKDYRFVPGGDTLMESVFAGLGAVRDYPNALIATADIPLVTPAAVHSFLAACDAKASEFATNIRFSVVPQCACTGPYESFTKSFNRFRDVSVCHGNLMLADTAILENAGAVSRINDVYGARKNAVKSALATGWRVGLSYVVGVQLLHLLTLDEMARIASKRFDTGIVPVLIDHPEITVDIDESADYEFVLGLLRQEASDCCDR